MTMTTVFKGGTMDEKLNVAEAKKKFSELLARTPTMERGSSSTDAVSQWLC